MSAAPQITWNLVTDVRQLFDYPFMVNALRAGTIVAIVAALIGWFMVLRRQTFAGHTLAVVSFPGASAAVLLGIAPAYGYFAFAVVAAMVFAVASLQGNGRRTEESAIIGTVQAFALGAGFLFVSLSHENVTGAQALLFGSFLGISNSDVIVLLAGAVATMGILALVARPLFFASIDPDVAAARGVPVSLLSVVFFLLLGVATAEASQITGSLLIFALLVLPAATAERLTARPGVSIVITVAIALLVTWIGLALSYYNNYPIGFHVTSLAFGAYVLAYVFQAAARRVPAHEMAR